VWMPSRLILRWKKGFFAECRCVVRFDEDRGHVITVGGRVGARVTAWVTARVPILPYCYTSQYRSMSTA
jgi:hypothetical protein